MAKSILLELLEARNYKELKRLMGEYNPVDLADLLMELNDRDLAIVFRMIEKDKAAEVFSYMDDDQRQTLLDCFTSQEIKHILDSMYTDDAVDLLEDMPANVVNKLLDQVSKDTRADINRLLNYPEDSAGSIMTVEYVDLSPDMTVRQALHKIRTIGIHSETVYTCYVIVQRKLVGIITAQALMTNDEDVQVKDLMEENFIFIRTTDDREDAAKLFRRYGLIAIPVLDKEGFIVGIVTFDDAIGVLTEETTEDIHKMAAIASSEESYLKTSVFQHAKNRIPWLLILMFSATITGAIITKYENAFQVVPILVSFIPMLIGTGCGVPGIMASRTIENDRDRKMTIMTTTFIPCGAKLPIIALFAGALFGGASWVAPSAYFVGIAAIICSGIILKKTKMFAGDPAPFVMELPAYHLPTVSNVLRSMWERGWSFIKKAGTVILLSTIFIWFTSSFGFVDGHFGMVEDLSDGILASIGQAIAWIFAPLGWGNWQAAVAAITGLVAKENVVGTFGILYGFAEVAEDGSEIWGTLAQSFTAVSAYSFLVFNLLCAPCFAAIGAIKREMNNARWTWFAIGYQTILAYVVALCIYQFGRWFTEGTFGVGTVAAIGAVAVFIYLLVRPYKEGSSLNVNVKAKTAS